MLQVAIFASGNLTTLQTQVNTFLATLTPHMVVSVAMTFSLSGSVVMIVHHSPGDPHQLS